MTMSHAAALSRFDPRAERCEADAASWRPGCWSPWPASIIAARSFETPSIRRSAIVRAFAEAAMVGGLADWFAVTALFRHPLGLPIPHTAIIPRNKDRIGDTLAAFLRDNFLTPTGRRAAACAARRGGRGRALPGPAAVRATGGCGAAPRALSPTCSNRSTTSGWAAWSRGAVAARLGQLEMAPLLGQALARGDRQGRRHRAAAGRHRPLGRRARSTPTST